MAAISISRASAVAGRCIRAAGLATAAVLAGNQSVTAGRLGLREARLLAEHTPVFVRAVASGDCPQSSDSTIHGNIATVVLRQGCKGYGWIDDIYVDLTTGSVRTDDGSTSQAEIQTKELSDLRKSLFATRAAMRLRAKEALCLLRKIPIPETEDVCRRTGVLREGDDVIEARIWNACPGAGKDTALWVTVDRYDGEVKNARTGVEYGSAALERLRLALIATHSPIRLSGQEASQLAGSPAVLAQLVTDRWLRDTKCVDVRADPINNADELWLQVWAGCGEQAGAVRLSVDVCTGALRIVGTSSTLDSTGIRRVRDAAMAMAKSRHVALIESTRKECP